MKDTFEIERAQLDRLIDAVGRFGAKVEEVWEEPEGSRFIGTYDGHLIRLFPKYDRNFALYFTVAHLYGHLVQLTLPKSIEFKRAAQLLSEMGRTLNNDDIQAVYDLEFEAAQIGRALMNEAGPISTELDRQYSRMFFADFHYLMNFIETRESGVDAFEKYLRREPKPLAPITADSRPLVNLANFSLLEGSAVVV